MKNIIFVNHINSNEMDIFQGMDILTFIDCFETDEECLDYLSGHLENVIS